MHTAIEMLEQCLDAIDSKDELQKNEIVRDLVSNIQSKEDSLAKLVQESIGLGDEALVHEALSAIDKIHRVMAEHKQLNELNADLFALRVRRRSNSPVPNTRGSSYASSERVTATQQHLLNEGAVRLPMNSMIHEMTEKAKRKSIHHQ